MSERSSWRIESAAAEVLRRIYQVTLAFTLVFLTISATTAFLRVESAPTEVSQSVVFMEEIGSNPLGERSREAEAIHVGVAFALALGGTAMFRRYQTVGLGVALSGLLLILVGSGGGGQTNYLDSLFGLITTGNAGQTRDIVYFLVLAFGSLALLAYGYRQWDAQTAVRDT